MCGIVGYVGDKQATPILIGGLRRLEYRGYDSAGVAVSNGHGAKVVRCRGKLSALEKLLETERPDGTVGIGHTRWATHGRPSDENAHPHKVGPVSVVHNGIIENHVGLRVRLKATRADLHLGDRHRDRRPPHRRGAQGGRRQPAGGGPQGAAPGGGGLRAGGPVRPAPRPGGRGQERLAAWWWGWARARCSWPPTCRRCWSTPAR